MASYLVPGFPAVSDALGRLRELDKELREGGAAFSAEASFHLANITAALTELEGHQRAAQEVLEAETTQNSKVAQRINSAKETMRREITADAAAVRRCRAAETDRLQKDLMDVSQLQEASRKSQEDLMRRNERLHAQRQRAEAEHEALVAALKDRVSVRDGLQMQLDRSRGEVEELTSRTVTAERDKLKLQQRMELEREALTEKREDVCRQAERVEEEIKQQTQAVRRGRRALAGVNHAKLEAQERLHELTLQMAALESSLLQAGASRAQRETELELQTQTHQRLREQTELLKKDLQERKVTSSTLIQRLQEEINTLEGETEDARASRELHRHALAHLCLTLEQQQVEEGDARAEHLRAEQRLQRSKLQLHQRGSSIARHRKEIREMEEQVRALRQAGTAHRRLCEGRLQEMSSTLEAQRSTVVHLEEERQQLVELLETARSRQEQREAKMTSDIRSTRRRCQELLQEEAALQEQQPVRLHEDPLRRHLEQREAKYREEEARQRQEVERCAADADIISQSNEEKQRQVEEEEERLREVEAAWRAEELRHRRMRSLLEELKTRGTDLELKLLELKEETRSLLQPRREAKAQLEVVQTRSLETLRGQAPELSDAESSLYDCGVKLEQVRMENSRFHLCIRQMMEAVSGAEEDADRYREEARLAGREAQDVLDSLRQRWQEDVSVTRDRQSRDGALLRAMDAARRRLGSRREELESLSRLSQQQTLELSRQLGDGDVPVQQSLSAKDTGTVTG